MFAGLEHFIKPAAFLQVAWNILFSALAEVVKLVFTKATTRLTKPDKPAEKNSPTEMEIPQKFFSGITVSVGFSFLWASVFAILFVTLNFSAMASEVEP